MNNLHYFIHLFIIYIIQIVILNNIQIGTYVHINLYILTLFIFPYKLKGVALLVSGFLLGFLMDLMTNTIGLNAAATTCVTYLRPWLLKVMINQEKLESGHFSIDFNGFVRYVIISTLIFNIIYIQMEAFSFSNYGITLLRIILSTFFSLLCIVLYYFVALKKIRNH